MPLKSRLHFDPKAGTHYLARNCLWNVTRIDTRHFISWKQYSSLVRIFKCCCMVTIIECAAVFIIYWWRCSIVEINQLCTAVSGERTSPSGWRRLASAVVVCIDGAARSTDEDLDSRWPSVSSFRCTCMERPTSKRHVCALAVDVQAETMDSFFRLLRGGLKFPAD